MKKILSGIIVIGMLSLFGTEVQCQTNAWIGPHLGFQKSPDGDDPSFLAGATLRLRLIPAIGVEGDIGYRQEKYGNGTLTLRQWPVTVTGLLYVLPVVYGGLGFGWYNTTADYSDYFNSLGFEDDTSQKLGWHLAAGLEIPASPGIHLFADVRYVFLGYKFKDFPSAVLDGAETDFYSVNGGVLFNI